MFRSLLAGILVLAAVCMLAGTALAEPPALKWGVDLEGGAPYAFTDPKHPSQVIGFEQDLADALASKLHRPIVRVQTNWDSLIPALDRHACDFAMNGLELTDEHRRGAAFTRPYYFYRQQIVVRQGDPRVKRFEDLKGKRVGTLSGSAAQRLLEKLGGVDMKFYSDIFAVYQDLTMDRLDAVFLDRPMAVYYARGNSALKFLEPPVGGGYYAIALRKDDHASRQALDTALTGMIRDGTLERILKRWQLWDGEQARLSTLHAPTDAIKPSASGYQRFLPMLLMGAGMTIKISLLAMAVAMGIGLLLAVMRIYGPAPLRMLSMAYVEIFRGTPLLIQLYLIYYGLPNLGIRLDAFVAGVLGLGLNYAANEAENYRAGIQAIPKGQSEASLALGLNRFQLLAHVILPQSLRVAIPPVTNDFIALFKDSSLVSVITLVELTKAYGMLASASYDYIGLGLVTALIYLIISYPASLFARWTESRMRRA